MLGLVVVVSPHLIGGALPWTALTIAVGGVLSLGAALIALPARRRTLPTAAWLVLLPLAWTAFQGAFLPCGLVATLAPEAAEEARAAQALLSDAPLSTCALSADPGNSREELIKWCGILSALVAAALLSRAGQGRNVLRGVALSGFAMTLSALGHWGAAAERVYGLYLPQNVGGGLFIAPLLNSNNLGGFLVLGAGVQAGLAASARDVHEQVAAWVAAAFGLTMACLTLSRGAIGATLMLGALLAIRDLRLRGRRGRGMRRSGLPRLRAMAAPLLLVLGGAGLSYFAAAPAFESALGDHDLSKLGLWGLSLPLLWEHPILGIGRGAFSAAFTALHGGGVRFAYVENFVLQWAVEWGIPVSLALLTGLFVLLGRTLLVTRSRLRYGAAAGLAAFFVQNLFDLALELAAPALVAAVVVGALPGRRPPAVDRAAFRPVWLLAASVLALALFAQDAVARSVPVLRAALETAAADTDTEAYFGLLAEGVRLHPQEAVLPYLAAGYALDAGDRRAPRLINRAMLLAPHWPGTHTLAARLLWGLGRRDQALGEMRRTFESVPWVAAPLGCEFAKRDPERAHRMVPQSGSERRFALQAIGDCLPRNSDVRRRMDQTLMAEYPDEEGAFLRESSRLQQLEGAAAAIGLLEAELARHPDKPQLWARLSELQGAVGEVDVAIEVLQDAEERLGPQPALLAQRARLAARRGDAEQARQLWARYRALSRGGKASNAQAYVLLGNIEELLGHRGLALEAYQESHRMSGDLGPLSRSAVLAEQLGRVDLAARLWRRACSMFPANAHACEESARLATEAARPNPRSL